jgi:hypothetical protein
MEYKSGDIDKEILSADIYKDIPGMGDIYIEF